MTKPDAVVVLDSSLLADPTVAEGLTPRTVVLADVENAPSLNGTRIVACLRAGSPPAPGRALSTSSWPER